MQEYTDILVQRMWLLATASSLTTKLREISTMFCILHPARLHAGIDIIIAENARRARVTIGINARRASNWILSYF